MCPPLLPPSPVQPGSFHRDSRASVGFSLHHFSSENTPPQQHTSLLRTELGISRDEMLTLRMAAEPRPPDGTSVGWWKQQDGLRNG